MRHRTAGAVPDWFRALRAILITIVVLTIIVMAGLSGGK